MHRTLDCELKRMDFRLLRHDVVTAIALTFFWLVTLVNAATQRSVMELPTLVIQHRELVDANEAAKNAVIFLFAGIAVVGGLMGVTYLISIIMDKIAPAPTSPSSFAAIAARRAALEAQMQNNLDGNDENRLDRGPLSRRANLWGLLMFERELILMKIFPTMSFDYDVKEISAGTENLSEDDTGGDVEMAAVSSATVGESMASEGSTEDATTANITKINEQPSPATDIESVLENATKNATDHYRMCCICLAPYENGIRVMTGAQCKHMFHDVCCQRWLLQHDHCPYCRKEMILPTDFRNAAVAVLGKDRVEELSVTAVVESNPSQLSSVS
jgi:Ring finger domain